MVGGINRKGITMWVVYKRDYGTKLYWNGSEFVRGRENALEMDLYKASKVAGLTWGDMEQA